MMFLHKSNKFLSIKEISKKIGKDYNVRKYLNKKKKMLKEEK